MAKIPKKFLGISLICLVLFVLDRFSKNFFLNNHNINLWGLTSFQKNCGFIFGAQFPGWENIFYTFIFCAFIILFYLLIVFLKEGRITELLATELIIIGALSNVLDRLFYGCVTDFISFWILGVFNMSDVYIFIGALFLFLNYLKK